MPELNQTSVEQLLVIDLQACSIEKIVEKKLQFCFANNKACQPVFDKFYKPTEQALIESCLLHHNKNQSQVARILNINRNTLKKKIEEYQISLSNLAAPSSSSPFMKRIYMIDLEKSDLLDLSRSKLEFLTQDASFFSSNPMANFCQPVEQIIIECSLDFHKNNHVKTSSFLNINRNTLKKKSDQYKMTGVSL